MEGLRLLLSHCDHTTLVKTGLQPSHHFWTGFMFNLGGFLWPHVLPHLTLWGLGAGAVKAKISPRRMRALEWCRYMPLSMLQFGVTPEQLL